MGAGREEKRVTENTEQKRERREEPRLCRGAEGVILEIVWDRRLVKVCIL